MNYELRNLRELNKDTHSNDFGFYSVILRMGRARNKLHTNLKTVTNLLALKCELPNHLSKYY